MIATKKQFALYSFGMIVPIIATFAPSIFVAASLVIATGFVLYIDISKYYNPKIKGLIGKFSKYFLLNESNLEIKQAKTLLSSASWLLLGMLITCIFFEKKTAITACLITNILGLFFALEVQAKIKFFDDINANRAFLMAALIFMLSNLASVFVGFGSSLWAMLINSVAISAVDFSLKSYRMVMNFLMPITYSLINFMLL